MSVFPEKSPKIYHFARSAKKFWPAPPPLGNGLGGGRRGPKSRGAGGGNAPFAPPPKPPLRQHRPK